MRAVYLLVVLLLIMPIVLSERVITDKGTYSLIKEDQKEIDLRMQEEFDALYDREVQLALEEPISISDDKLVFYIALGAFLFIIVSIVVFAFKNISSKKENKVKKSRKQEGMKQKRVIRESTDMLEKYGLRIKEENKENISKETDILKKYNLSTLVRPVNESGEEIDILKKYNLYSNLGLKEDTNVLHSQAKRITKEITEEREGFEYRKFTARDLHMRRIIIDFLDNNEDVKYIAKVLIDKGYQESEIKHHIKHIKKTLALRARLEAVAGKLDDLHYI